MRRWLGCVLVMGAGCFFGELSLLPETGGGGGVGGSGGPGGMAGAGGMGGAGGELAIACGEVLVPPTWPATCGACVAGSGCCAAAETCASDEACAAFLACLDEHHGPHATYRCAYEFPLSSAQNFALLECLYNTCRSACLDDNWGCNESYGWPDPIAATGILELQAVASDLGYVPDGTAKACDDGPFGDCGSPVVEVTSDPGAGAIYLDLPLPFSGYFTLATAEHYPLRIYPWPVWRDALMEIPLLSIGGLADLAVDVGEPVEPGMGRLWVRVHTCSDVPGPGVSFELAGNAIVDQPTPYYFGAGGPLPGATGTTEEGYVLWLNVPPGATTITGVLEDSGDTVVQDVVRIDADGQTVLLAYPKTTP